MVWAKFHCGVRGVFPKKIWPGLVCMNQSDSWPSGTYPCSTWFLFSATWSFECGQVIFKRHCANLAKNERHWQINQVALDKKPSERGVCSWRPLATWPAKFYLESANLQALCKTPKKSLDQKVSWNLEHHLLDITRHRHEISSGALVLWRWCSKLGSLIFYEQ